MVTSSCLNNQPQHLTGPCMGRECAPGIGDKYQPIAVLQHRLGSQS
jgi:hypothetical protein